MNIVIGILYYTGHSGKVYWPIIESAETSQYLLDKYSARSSETIIGLFPFWSLGPGTENKAFPKPHPNSLGHGQHSSHNTQ